MIYNLNMNKLIKIFFILLMISSCEVTTTNKQKRMDKNDPEYKKYLEQEHRFEFNKCKLKYNGKPFYIGMSLEEFKTLFGEGHIREKNIIDYNKDPYYIFYEEKGIAAVFEYNKLRSIYIYINNGQRLDSINLSGNKSILFNNTILKQTDKMHEFLDRTNITFDDFEISSSGYLQRYTCKKDTLIYYLESPVYYHRIGGGHMAISGDWKLDETNPIKSFHFYIDNKPPSEFQ